MAAEAAQTPEGRGQALVQANGCAACHSIDGSKGIGPTWFDVAGSQVPLADGSIVTADDAYLMESIHQPQAKIVAVITSYSIHYTKLYDNTYDELGRLIQKKRHNDTDIEEFDYNIRNWSTRLKSGTFEEKLYYNTELPNGITPCYNGNIAMNSWTYNGSISKYTYNYDGLNRLLACTNYDINNQPSGWFTESFGYDKMGNINSLWRMGASSPIDALTLTYKGNQLTKVDDWFGSRNQYAIKEYNNRASEPIEFTYDGNGNMIKDLDRNIVTIRYNLLNLPEIIQFKNGNQITNTYDAGGQKLKTRYYTVYNYATQPIVAENTIRDFQLNDEVYVDGTDYVNNAEYNYYAEYYSGELSRITSYNVCYTKLLRTLSFLYDSGEEAYETRIRGYIKTYTTTCNQNTPSPRAFYSLFYNGDWNTIYNDQNYNYQDIKHYKYYLKQIVHNRTGNKIVFNSSIRNDLFGGKKIDKITVVNNNDSIYSWKLGYSYFTTLWKNPKDNYVDKRLKLVSIQKSSKFNKLENPYTFSYYNDIVDSKLPFRNCTNGYDHWGCFNSLIETDNDAKNALKSFPKMNDVVKYASHYLPTYSPMYNMFSIDTYYSITIPNNLYDLNLLITKMGNRNVNEEYTKALSLKEIKYPTGGKTTFYYETNKCSSAGGYFDPNTVVSGLRIQKVVSQTTNDSTIKTYSYEHGTSMYFSKPNYFYIIKDSYERQYMPGAPTGCMNFQNYPDFSNISNGELISYTKVEEKTSLGSDNWKTAYSYKNESLYDGDKIYEMVGVIKTNTFECSQLKSVYNYSDAVQPFNMKILGKSYKNGLLSNIKYFKKDILIKEEKYDYNYVDGNKIYSNITKPYEEELFWCASGYAETKRFYYYDIYYHQTGKNFLKRKKTTDYDQNGLNPVIKSTLYEYNADNELIKNLTDSLGDKTIKKEIKYPGDSYFNYYHGQPHPFQQMQILNMINYPIEQKTFVNNKLTDATITTYMSDNPSTSTGKILPNATYGLNTNTPLTDFTALSSGDGNTAYTIDPRMSQEITYNYYSDGNVREVFSPKTGITTTYLWSYNGQYPVAVVKNATYTQVNNAYHGSVDYLRNLIAPTNEVISSMSGLLRSNLPNSQIITYTYKPLVGMLTATDPRGVTTYYEYDDFNRLKETYIIENGLKKVLQKYDYHYQNQ